MFIVVERETPGESVLVGSVFLPQGPREKGGAERAGGREEQSWFFRKASLKRERQRPKRARWQSDVWHSLHTGVTEWHLCLYGVYKTGIHRLRGTSIQSIYTRSSASGDKPPTRGEDAGEVFTAGFWLVVSVYEALVDVGCDQAQHLGCVSIGVRHSAFPTVVDFCLFR